MQLPADGEVRRDRPFPLGSRGALTSAWQHYVDNFDGAELFDFDGFRPHARTLSEDLARGFDLYEVAGALGNEDQEIRRSTDVTTLGVRIDELLGRRDVPPNYVWKLASSIFWLLGLAGGAAFSRADCFGTPRPCHACRPD